jgi:hypothetical protein
VKELRVIFNVIIWLLHIWMTLNFKRVFRVSKESCTMTLETFYVQLILSLEMALMVQREKNLNGCQADDSNQSIRIWLLC